MASLTTADRVRPRLLSFEVMITASILKLTFSKSVEVTFSEIDILSVNSVTLQSLYVANPLARFTLTVDNSSDEDGTVIQIKLSVTDLVEIQKFQQLSYSQGSCYLTFDSSFIEDKAVNAVVPQLPGQSPVLIAMTFVEDNIDPKLMCLLSSMQK